MASTRAHSPAAGAAAQISELIKAKPKAVAAVLESRGHSGLLPKAPPEAERERKGRKPTSPARSQKTDPSGTSFPSPPSHRSPPRSHRQARQRERTRADQTRLQTHRKTMHGEHRTRGALLSNLRWRERAGGRVRAQPVLAQTTPTGAAQPNRRARRPAAAPRSPPMGRLSTLLARKRRIAARSCNALRLNANSPTGDTPAPANP